MEVNKSRNNTLLLISVIIVSILLCACQPSFKNKAKVLLIGLDGASWNVMQPLIEDGKLPNIKQLLRKGCWAEMQTSEPMASELVWTSIATAKIPDKHGIVDRLMEDPESKEFVPPSSNLRKVKAIWNILSENNKKVGVVNYMVTWPPEKVNGAMISHRKVGIANTTYLSKDLSFPPFTQLCSEEEFEGLRELKTSLFSKVERDKFLPFLWLAEEVDNFGANFARYLLRKQPFDFFCLYIQGTDIVSHYAWKYLFPEGFRVSGDDIQKYKDLINNYYIWCDKVIGDMLRLSGSVDLVIIASDHGFKTRANSGYIFTNVDYLLKLCGSDNFKKAGQNILLKNVPADIDSFAKNIQIIGNLSQEEFYHIRERAKSILRQITVKETKDHLFATLTDTKKGFVIKLSKIYKRPDPGHHLIIKGRTYKITDFIMEHIFPGDHARPALLIITGRHIRHNTQIKSATIYDITPTILYYLGLPVAKDMDGKVLVEAIEESYLKKNPVRYVETYETKDKENMVERPIRSSDEEKIKERMRSLGYIN